MGIVKKTGFCEFCFQGRLVAIQDNREFTQEELNRIASDECECSLAKSARERAAKLERAEYFIENLVPDHEEDIKPLLRAAISPLADQVIKKMSLNVGGKVTYSIYRDKKDSITIQRQETITREEEIE